MSENVIRFPKINPRAEKDRKKVRTQEELIAEFEHCYENYIENVSTHLTRSVIHKAGSFGYIFDSETNMKDIVMIHETIKTAMLRVHDIHHPMQDAADDCEIRVEEIDDDGDVIESREVQWHGMDENNEEEPVD